MERAVKSPDEVLRYAFLPLSIFSTGAGLSNF